MKNSFLSALALTILISMASTSYGQLELKIKFSNITCDSIRIKSFDWKKKSGVNLAKPFQPTTLFQEKFVLKPGIYQIAADTTPIASFILPSVKSQKVEMSIDGSTITFKNDAENTRYQAYLQMLADFDKKAEAMDKQFQAAQNLPNYMKQTLADSLSARFYRMVNEKENFEQKILAELPNTLIAAVVRANLESPVPPQLYGNQTKMTAYVVEHFFDHFPWDDPRIFNTPEAEAKLKRYCDIIYQFDRPELDTFVVQSMRAASINEESYLLFFDRLERTLGYYMSNYKVEHTYIKMLKEILKHPKLEKQRKVFYEYELSNINKNLDGMLAPNFRFVTERGDTTDLYSFQSEYTLMLLHNPTCTTCREVRNRIAGYPLLNQAIQSGRLNVLTIYMERDPKIWASYLTSEAAPNYRHGWNFDNTIEKEQLYESRTIPYMFLLDKNKRIIRKNLLYNEIEGYIQQLDILQEK